MPATPQGRNLIKKQAGTEQIFVRKEAGTASQNYNADAVKIDAGKIDARKIDAGKNDGDDDVGGMSCAKKVAEELRAKDCCHGNCKSGCYNKCGYFEYAENCVVETVCRGVAGGFADAGEEFHDAPDGPPEYFFDCNEIELEEEDDTDFDDMKSLVWSSDEEEVVAHRNYEDVSEDDSDSDFELEDFEVEDDDDHQADWQVCRRLANGLQKAMISMITKDKNDEGRYDGSVLDPRQQHCNVNLLDSEYIIDINVAEAVTYASEFFEELFEVALDSGAGEHVADNKDAPSYLVQESAGSRAGQNFIAANNHRIPNRGQMTLALQCEKYGGKKGREIKTTFQVAAVSRPLWSVGRICDEGFEVKLLKDEAQVLKKDGTVVCRFKRQGGLYIAKMSLRNPLYKSFQRQGTKA